MKAHLLFADRDLDVRAAEPDNADELTGDLELDTLLDAMASGDDLIRSVSRSVLLNGLLDPAEVGYRQHVLNDCLHNPEGVRGLYTLAGQAIAAERGVFRGFFAERPESLLRRSVQVLELFVDSLKALRRSTVELAPGFKSDGFQQFFSVVTDELDDAYFGEVNRHLKMLRFNTGVLVSARLGHGNEGAGFVLRRPNEENKSLFNRVGLRKPNFSYTIPDRDEVGLNALSDLRDRGLDEVANAAAQSCDHVLSFFHALRAELAFYLGCVNLHGRLSELGASECYPTVHPVEAQAWSVTGLYDVCLALRMQAKIVGNTIDADAKRLVMVTGANQGGKSTFLRSVGLSQLMMSAGMFVCADKFAAATRAGVFTHFKREEDEAMAGGKFDEELARMSVLTDEIGPGALLLYNESFQSTNEREGSEIARQVINAMVDSGVTVVFVTHLYDLARSLYVNPDAPSLEHKTDETVNDASVLRAADEGGDRLFLRAERDTAGQRTFQVRPGEPLPTSYGADLYDRIIGSAASAVTVG
jgi:DNA mismatch repair ATPase MutS